MNKYAPKNIDRIEAQSYYDAGMSLTDLSKHYSVTRMTIYRLQLKTRSHSDTMKLCNKLGKRTWTKEGLFRLSQHAKKNKLGGYRPHPNKGIRYNGTWFDSAWEVKVAMSLDENNIRWVRPKIGFVWTDSGRKYYPDFYLPEYNVYLDPKNSYLIKKDAIKICEAQKRNNITVLILTESQLNWDTINSLL